MLSLYDMLFFRLAILAIVLLLGLDIRGQTRRYDDFPEMEGKFIEGTSEVLWRILAAEKGLKGVIVVHIDSVKEDTEKVVKYRTDGKSLREFYVRKGKRYLQDSTVLDFDSLGHVIRKENGFFGRKYVNLYQYANGFLSKVYRYQPDRNELTFTSYYLGTNGRFRRIVEHDDNASGSEFTVRLFRNNNMSLERSWRIGSDEETIYRYEYDTLGRMTQMVIEEMPPPDSNNPSRMRWSRSYFNKRLVFRDSAHAEYKSEFRFNVKSRQWDSLPWLITVTDSVRNITVRLSHDSTGKVAWTDSMIDSPRKQHLKNVTSRLIGDEVDRTVTQWEYGNYGEIISEKKEYSTGKGTSTRYYYDWK
jgi:hypothetical protein